MKYPRTYHIDSSPNLINDDRKIESLEYIIGKNVTWTEKCDGECTFLGYNKIHARSEKNDNHPSRNWVKGLWGSMKHNIPENLGIFGESMFACHSIFYDKLTTYFYVFNIVNLQEQKFLSVDETMNWSQKLGLEYVPILKRGIFEKDFEIPTKSKFGETAEGYVCRIDDEFAFKDFDKYCLKYVRSRHVTSDQHWKTNWKPNKLLGK
jgi:hypothetical protein